MGCTLRFIINGGLKLNRGLQAFRKIIKRGVKINGGVGTKYKREGTKIGFSVITLLTSLNIGISSILQSHLQ